MKTEDRLFERPRLVSMITVAVVVAAALAYALIPTTRHVDPATETFTADNIIAQTSIQLNSATPSTLTSFDGSKKLASFTGSSSTPCGAGSAVTGVSIAANGNVSVTCGAGGVAASGLNVAEFGFGGDGPITFDGSTTVTVGGVAMAPSSSVYTLGTDIEATNLTINNGVTVKMAGFRIFGNGTCTNNGTASDNGNNGANGTNVAAGTGGAARAVGYLPVTSAGINGGINSTTTADNNTFSRGLGVSAIASCNAGGTGQCGGLGGAAFIAGAGGNGSNGAPCQGGAAGGGGGANIGAAGGQDSSGGTIGLTAANRGAADVWQIDHGFFVYPTNIITATMPYGTGGGGGAAGGGSTQPGGGGGGAPGGTVDWHCRIMAGSGVFAAAGGSGGTGACDGTSGHGCTGGGGGGGGGAIMLVYSTNTGTWTTNVLGGNLGAGAGPQTNGGAGGSGGSGGACKYLPINLSGDGT